MNHEYDYFKYDFYVSQDCPGSFPTLEFRRAGKFLNKLRKTKDEGKGWYLNALWQPTHIIESVLQTFSELDEPYTEAERSFLMACLSHREQIVVELAMDAMEWVFENEKIPYYRTPDEWNWYLKKTWEELRDKEKTV